MGRLEADWPRRLAINVLGNGLSEAGHDDDALSVGEAELAMMRRLGAPEASILVVQSNLANTYSSLGRFEEALSMERGVYFGRLRLHGEEHEYTLRSASNYASSFISLERFEEAKSLLRKTTPVARRVLGEGGMVTLGMRQNYAAALVNAGGATLDDLREAVKTLEEIKPIARRVLGGAHPLTAEIERLLQEVRLCVREAPSPG